MDIKIEIMAATTKDVEELLKLYYVVYGNTYPLSLGTDPQVMKSMITSEHNLWLVARNKKNIVGSFVIESDLPNKIARAEGLVIHPDYRRHQIGQRLVEESTQIVLEKRKNINSIYATTRTLSLGPQRIFLNNNFQPLGIFPNAHKLRDYETLTLFAKFRDGLLEKRKPTPKVPQALGPLIKIVNEHLKSPQKPKLMPLPKLESKGSELNFELIDAPHFVKERFHKTFTDPYDRFYPFHEPNVLLVSENNEVEIYAYVSKADGYCTIVALTKPCYELAGRLKSLLYVLRNFGVTYIELLMGLEHTKSLEALLHARFLPSALYPAMFEVNGEIKDMVIMSRTMEPLDFRGMEIAPCFKPFVDQYVELWKKTYLDVLGVKHE